MSALHIKLLCWDHHHVQAISDIALRSMRCAPICTYPIDTNAICGSPIWAVEHEGEPTRYVGRPPHRNWESWADCIPATPRVSSEENTQ